MKKVTGIGGIFFKSKDKEALYHWYEDHLGIEPMPHGGGAVFEWRDVEKPDETGQTAWALFPHDTKHFAPSQSSFMINYRVDDLNGLLEQLKKEGVEIDPHREDCEYGRFAWIMDPEGNRIELWEPKK